MAASATTGVLNPLLGKLGQLLGEEYKKLTGVRRQASFLKDELSAMKALLDKMELMDNLDPSAKNWRDHIREMSYDMENCIDDFIHDIEGARAKKGFVRKMAQRLRRLGRRHQIANRIEELKVLVVEANARRERYNIDDCINSSHDTVAVDPRILAIYMEAAGLVGIDGPREELVSLLMDSQKKLKVVSITGFGGLGKTTLAKQVHDEVGGQFNCKAFISVSQRPDVKSLLSGLQLKLGMKDSSSAHELQDIIDHIREHLKDKRYFIVVDDLWDQQAWDIISCAFPENSTGSRVMVTTRLDDVAVKVCQSDRACIYRVKPLNEQDSRRLFFNRVFGSENVCPPQFKEISVEILRKCGGLPLAIITIASLLASHEARLLNEWESIKISLGAKFATKPTLEEMRGILNLSYMHLPIHLRPCFLYLGMYPEDREIYTDDLVQQWIAEGFVCSLHGVDLDVAARSYFNDLINRSLVQPVKTFYGEISSCRVHDMMLDYPCNQVLVMQRQRPLLLACHKLDHMHSLESPNTHLLFHSSSMCGLLYFEFPYKSEWTLDLTAISHLFLLRYLKVLDKSADIVLPTEIQVLAHLETLGLHCNSAQNFPSDISRLANLLHLVLPNGTVLPKGIQNMKSVCTLHCSGMSESSLEDIEGLSKLTNLKELSLRTRHNECLTVERLGALVSSIGMLRDLKHFELSCFNIGNTDPYSKQFGLNCSNGGNDPESRLDSLHDPPPRLEKFYLQRWDFPRVPKWIGELGCLRLLSLRVLRPSSDGFRVLGELPSLVTVKLHVSDVSQDKAVVVGTGLFPVLEFFHVESDEDVTAYLSFEAGAMPKLRTLVLGFGWEVWKGATPVGMERLPCLHHIHLHLRCCGSSQGKNWEDVRAQVESAFKSATSLHPRHPSVSVY